MKTFDAPLADWEASMKTNATGLFALTRAFGNQMASNGTGSIVNIVSIQGMVGPNNTLYEGLEMHAIPDDRSVFIGALFRQGSPSPSRIFIQP